MERPHSRFVESLPGDVVAFLTVYLGGDCLPRELPVEGTELRWKLLL
jgi:hypothetical protein